MRINVTRSSMPDFNEYCEEIKKLWDSHWLTNMGTEHRLLQTELEQYLHCPHVTLFANGHLALEAVINAMSFPHGSEVITTPFTFVSTTHAITRCGLKPVFCDVEPDYYTMDPDKIESLITDKTVAILPVHVYGNVCNVDKIASIARKYDLKVIYDAAHAFAVKYKGVSTANFGNASMFSFHATKVFNTIEGGAVCFSDDALLNPLNELKNFGIYDEEHVVCVGGNAKMNEFQAAMGLCNLRHLDDEISKRKSLAARYHERLDGIPGIKLCKPQEHVNSNYAYFPVVFDGYRKNRDAVYEELKHEGIMARKYFYPLTNSFECYKDSCGADKNRTPIAAHYSNRVLTLPLYADLSQTDVDTICDIIMRY